MADQGFGALTEIDVKATLEGELNEDIENYLILGACSPSLAYRAIGVNRQIGLLLPCNVVVRSDPDNPADTIVEAMNLQLLVDVTEEPQLQPIAHEVADRLKVAIATLSA